MGKFKKYKELYDAINELQDSVGKIQQHLNLSEFKEPKVDNVISSFTDVEHIIERNKQAKEFVAYMWENLNTYYGGHIETIVNQSVLAIDYINYNGLDLSELRKGLVRYSSLSEMESLREELDERKQNNTL